MKELNELVEQAKFVADWYGSDWISALCKDKDGKQAHEIICESRGESVISTGSNSNEASWLCDYLELCSPANILAIAEAFRALEQEPQKNLDGALAWQQRAEAAEAKLAAARGVKKSWQERAWTAEEKLAELEKQEPVAWTSQANLGTLKSEPRKTLEFMTGDKSIYSNPVPLFALPAPAFRLAELVPDEMTLDSDTGTVTEMGHAQAVKWWNACRAAILRNIEEQSQ